MPKIIAIAGSYRENSYNKRVLNIAVEGAREAGAEVTLIDLRDFPMPILNMDDVDANGFDDNAARFQDILNEHNGILIASPEYNGSIPGGLKNAIDWASRQSDKYKTNEVFRGKVAAMITASPGSFGGIRCLNHLRGVFSILGVNVLPSEIAVGFVGQKFEGDSPDMTDDKMKAILKKLGTELVTMLKKTHGDIGFVSDTSS
ncbi:MAG: NAD(P)H-dependent oxidoreductase [Pyrinomonadaceae bacterium]|nr:NAD(P)H-dependent oxidoreductase [Chloracidobacterium sp.]